MEEQRAIGSGVPDSKVDRSGTNEKAAVGVGESTGDAKRDAPLASRSSTAPQRKVGVELRRDGPLAKVFFRRAVPGRTIANESKTVKASAVPGRVATVPLWFHGSIWSTWVCMGVPVGRE